MLPVNVTFFYHVLHTLKTWTNYCTWQFGSSRVLIIRDYIEISFQLNLFIICTKEENSQQVAGQAGRQADREESISLLASSSTSFPFSPPF